MLAPRFGIRTILICVAGLALFFLLVGMGVRGHLWPGAVAFGIASFGLVAVVYAALFMVCFSYAHWAARRGGDRAANKFDGGSPADSATTSVGDT